MVQYCALQHNISEKAVSHDGEGGFCTNKTKLKYNTSEKAVSHEGEGGIGSKPRAGATTEGSSAAGLPPMTRRRSLRRWGVGVRGVS